MSRNNPIPPKVPQEPQITEDQVKLANEVQRARDKMYEAIAQYRALLQQTTLASQRSKMQNDQIANVFKDLNQYNGTLEKINVGEGPLALTFTALNSILGLKDEINELKFQNTVMYKKLKELETQKDSKQPEQK